MHFIGLGTANPEHAYDNATCLAGFERSAWHDRLDGRARALLRLVLQHDNGIDTRQLAVDPIDEAFHIDADTLARRFETHAPALAAAAARRALADAGLPAQAIDAVVVSTCTGTLCPGLTGHLVERLGLRQDVLTHDLVGQGCGAALPNLQLGRALLGSGSASAVLSVCVEVCSAAMYLDDDAGVLISACLFGDGAGAAVLAREARPGRAGLRWVDSASLTRPEHRQALRFESTGGLQRNRLGRQVPGLAAEYAHQVLSTVLERVDLHPGDVGTWALHAGGRDVLLALQKRLELQPQHLRHSAAMLRRHGNLSSAFVYFVLQAALAEPPDPAAGPWWWLSSFGAGFACHGALLELQ